jgi:hypothetical protein
MRRTILVLLFCGWEGLEHAGHTPARLLEGDHSQELLIDEHGTIVAHSLKNASDSPEWIVNSIDEFVARMEFIPGFYDGKAVPTFYVEPAWFRCP